MRRQPYDDRARQPDCQLLRWLGGPRRRDLQAVRVCPQGVVQERGGLQVLPHLRTRGLQAAEEGEAVVEEERLAIAEVAGRRRGVLALFSLNSRNIGAHIFALGFAKVVAPFDVYRYGCICPPPSYNSLTGTDAQKPRVSGAVHLPLHRCGQCTVKVAAGSRAPASAVVIGRTKATKVAFCLAGACQDMHCCPCCLSAWACTAPSAGCTPAASPTSSADMWCALRRADFSWGPAHVDSGSSFAKFGVCKALVFAHCLSHARAG
mmetsp:Transcript_92600/g.267382  ORF Transcript_92600/g.267382 Transcript_92600/m.267382 type:complete len:263 (+) Transcript_92600:285-1073(+)